MGHTKHDELPEHRIELSTILKAAASNNISMNYHAQSSLERRYERQHHISDVDIQKFVCKKMSLDPDPFSK